MTSQVRSTVKNPLYFYKTFHIVYTKSYKISNIAYESTFWAQKECQPVSEYTIQASVHLLVARAPTLIVATVKPALNQASFSNGKEGNYVKHAHEFGIVFIESH